MHDWQAWANLIAVHPRPVCANNARDDLVVTSPTALHRINVGNGPLLAGPFQPLRNGRNGRNATQQQILPYPSHQVSVPRIVLPMDMHLSAFAARWRHECGKMTTYRATLLNEPDTFLPVHRHVHTMGKWTRAGPVKHHLPLCPTTGLEHQQTRSRSKTSVARLPFKLSYWFGRLSNLCDDRYYITINSRITQI